MGYTYPTVNSIGARNPERNWPMAMTPLHARTLTKTFNMLKSDWGKQIIANGWKAAGITQAVEDARKNDVMDLIDPFSDLSIYF